MKDEPIIGIKRCDAIRDSLDDVDEQRLGLASPVDLLFQSLLGVGLVDSVEVGIMPVLLGGGVPFLPSPAVRQALVLKKHMVYPKTGTVGLEYDVRPASTSAGRTPRRRRG